jgi:hypothetical protein
MRILVDSEKKESGEWAKERLEEFGRGMHITVVQNAGSRQLGGNWSYIIVLGECPGELPAGKPVARYPIPKNEAEEAELKRSLWALYRDELRDMIGSKCSCGLYDVCHCH